MINKENQLMMLLVIGSETIFFISLILGYIYFWQSGNYRESVKSSLDIGKTTIYTILLLASSFTIWLAEYSYKRKHTRKLKFWLLMTVVLGIIFLIGQGLEYYKLLSINHLTLGSSVFGTTFYTLTGFHGLHVLIGLIILLTLFLLTLKGFFNRETSLLRTAAIYWHFVDGVWLLVFLIIYVIPYL
ncbi:MAG: cytochrome c oxidase subunit 3 [Flavisolibacter sp.]